MTNKHCKKLLRVFLCVALLFALTLALGACAFCWEKEDGDDIAANAPAAVFDAEEFAGLIAQKQRELFLSVEESISAPNAKKLTVDFAVQAIPLEIEDGGSATVYLRGHKIPLQLKDGILEGKARVPLSALSYDDGPPSYRILVQSGKTQRNQAVTPAFYFHVTPFAGGIEVGEYADGKLDLTISYELDNAYVPFGDTAVSANVNAVMYSYSEEGEKEFNVVFGQSFEDGALYVQEPFELGDNDRLRFYAEVEGKSGLVYRYWLEDFVSPAYADIFEFPWWEDELESREYIYIAAPGGETFEFWF